MGAGHDHDHAGIGRAGERHRGRLFAAFVIIAAFFVVEAVAGFWTNSLALISDAGHMLTDVVGLGMALAAIQLASRFAERGDGDGADDGASSSHTFGLYRLEILAAFVNALLLFGVALWVFVEAVRRLFDQPEILTGAMLTVAIVGLIANLIAFLLLREGAEESIAIEGAYLEVLADTVGSVGVIIAALLMRWFGWAWVDPVVAALIGLWIVPRTFRLGRRAVRILLQAAPEHLAIDEVALALAAIDGVVDVHDLHVWTLTSDMDAASAHLVASEGVDHHHVLDQARSVMGGRFGIDHGTFQVEPESHEGCGDVDW